MPAVIGRLGDQLLGGGALDVPARQAMTEWGQQLGLSAEDTAEGILKVITATMARIRKVSVERGVDLRACDLIAFGSWPITRCRSCSGTQYALSIIPPGRGASAVGMLDAPIRYDYATSGRQHAAGTK